MGSQNLQSGQLSGKIMSDAELDLELEDWRKSDVDFETIAITETRDPQTFSSTCIMPPIVTSTVFNAPVESRFEGPRPKFYYSRCGNPTKAHLESVLAKLEGASHALTFSSGIAAVSAVFQACAKGDHLIVVQVLSGDTDWLMKNKVEEFGMTYDEAFSRETEDIVALVKANTKIILLEQPSNPLLEVADIQAISLLAKEKNPQVLIIVDNTILTPFFFRPLEFGADVVVYSLTKYFVGFSDVVMGSIVCNSDALYESYKNCQIFLGAIPSPMDCYLVLRSLKTFPLRMQQHFRNAMKVAHYLEAHPSVVKLFYPGLRSHTQSKLVRRNQTGCSALMSFYLRGEIPEAIKFIKALKYFRFAGSFGSDVSLIALPSVTSQQEMSPESQRNVGIEQHLIRISVGLENAEILIRDLDHGLSAVAGGVKEHAFDLE